MHIRIINKMTHQTVIYAGEELKDYLSLLNIDLSFSFLNAEKNGTEGINYSHILDDSSSKYEITLMVQEDLSNYDLPHVKDSKLDDGYYVEFTKKAGLIVGSNPRSVLLGVYQYLYKLGFRFLYPDKKSDYIPKIDEFKSLLITLRSTAFKRHRGVCIEGANSLENIIDFINWLPKLGYNSFFVQFQIPYIFMARWYEHWLNTILQKTDNKPLTMEKVEAFSDRIDKELSKLSLLHHRVGHGWTSETIGQPSIGWMDVKEESEEEKKDGISKDSSLSSIKPLLAKVNGKREFFKGIPTNTNLCYSNDSVIQKFTDNVVLYAKKHPDIDYLHVWLADEYNNICECPDCVKTTPSDQYVHLLNIIDEKLNQLSLPTKIVFLLYQELLWAPVKEKIKNPNRFVLMFAPISRTFEHSYRNNLKPNPVPDYDRNKIELPTNLNENIAYLHQWQKDFSGDSFIYDYPLGRAHYGDLGYLHISKLIYEDIKSLHLLGLDGYISCQELRAGLPNPFPNYIMGLALFHSCIGYENIRYDYFKHAYGEDYQFVMDYMEQLSAHSNCDYYNGKGEREDWKLHNNYKKIISIVADIQPTIKRNLSELQQKSEKENHNMGIHIFFWDLLKYHSEYTLRFAKALSYLSKGDYENTEKYWTSFREYICSHEEEFQSALDVYRVVEVSTKYTGFPIDRTPHMS